MSLKRIKSESEDEAERTTPVKQAKSNSKAKNQSPKKRWTEEEKRLVCTLRANGTSYE